MTIQKMTDTGTVSTRESKDAPIRATEIVTWRWSW
jgi:hypothetical protein